MDASKIAKVCHEVNRAFCSAIGDDSQVPWEEAPEWQRESAEKGVQAVLDDPKMTPEVLHLKWLEDKCDAGWRYGLVKDAEKKTHPCIVSYNELSKEQQIKDHLFQAVVNSMKDL